MGRLVHLPSGISYVFVKGLRRLKVLSCRLLLARACCAKTQMEANPEVKEAAMREMMLVSGEMGALLKQHRIHFPKMLLSMFGQFPVFISLFLATRDVS